MLPLDKFGDGCNCAIPEVQNASNRLTYRASLSASNPAGRCAPSQKGLVLTVTAAAQRYDVVFDAVLVSLRVHYFKFALYQVRTVQTGSDSDVCHYEKTSGLLMCSGCRFRLLIRPSVA